MQRSTFEMKVKNLERDRARLLAVLRELVSYCARANLPRSHPLSEAHALLRELDHE